MGRPLGIFVILATFLLQAGHALAADVDEFKVKRQEVYEFTEKPKVTRDATTQPDRFRNTFTSKAYCDATVAIDDAQGKIIRHLASRMLGPTPA